MKLSTTLLALTIFVVHISVLIYALHYYNTISTYFKLPIKHGRYCLISLMVMSLAVSIFRILQDVETLPIKFLHALLNVFAVWLIYYSLKDMKDPKWHFLHGFPASIVYYGFFAQIALAFIIFVALPSNDLRESISAIHTVIGLWLYYCYIGIALTGFHNCSSVNGPIYKLEVTETGVENNGCLKILDYYKHLVLIAAVLINFLLLFPYFQWDVIYAV